MPFYPAKNGGKSEQFIPDGTIMVTRGKEESRISGYATGVLSLTDYSNSWGGGGWYVKFTSTSPNILARIVFTDNVDRVYTPSVIQISGSCNTNVLMQSSSDRNGIAYMDVEITNISGTITITRTNSGTSGGMSMLAQIMK